MTVSTPQEWTLVNVLRDQVARRPGAVYCAFEAGPSCTFKELDDASDAFATALAERGIGPGDHIMISARNRVEFLIAFYGVQKRRAVFIPINIELRGSFLRHQIANSTPRAIIVDADLFNDVDQSELSGVEFFVTIDVKLAKPLTDRAVTFNEFVGSAREDVVLRPEPADTCLILYTSGTSGPSKGVIVPQAHAYLFGLQQLRAMQVSPEDVYYVCLPLFHVNALLMSLGSCLHSGAKAHIAARFSASGWINEIAACGATLTNMLGTMAEFILSQPSGEGDQTHRLKRIMAVPVSGSWGAVFSKRFAIELIQVYGMTECNIVSFTRPGEELVPGRVGPISDSFFEVAILDAETGRNVSTDEVGEICVRPLAPSGFMEGYYSMPEVTVKAWRGLWFHTGDAGRIDRRGDLHFIDRLGDCIRRRGENISSFEIEQVLLTSPRITECAVIGIKVEGAGGEEEVKACLVTNGDAFDFVEFTNWCVARLPRYAVPRFVELYGSLMKTATGKVQKQKLRQLGVTSETWDREKAGLVLVRAQD